MKTAAILTNQLASWEDSAIIYPGGGERVCIEIAEMLIGWGYDVSVFQYSHKPFVREYCGFKIIGIASRRTEYETFLTGVCDEFFDATKNHDLVIINCPEMACGQLREDVILVSHGTIIAGKNPNRLSSSIRDRLIRAWESAKTNIVVHEFVRDAAREIGYKDSDSMTLIHNYVDTSIFVPSDKKRKILFPGRAELQKGAYHMLEITNKTDAIDGWQTVWCGRGSCDKFLEKLSRNRKSFIKTSRDLSDMHKEYADSEICVVLNIDCRGDSLTTMEAMSCECACIGIFGGTTIIEDGVTGLLCKSVSDVVECIGRLTNSPDMVSRLGAAARKLILSRFSKSAWEKEWKAAIAADG